MRDDKAHNDLIYVLEREDVGLHDWGLNLLPLAQASKKMAFFSLSATVRA